MLQAANTDLFINISPYKAHKSECQNQFPLQTKPLKVS